ncbi:MAG: hypothetical protein ACJ8AH_05290 [Stellaceae bacterium]
MSPLKVKPPSVVLVLAALLAALGVARGGHELPVYPSYYPHEIAMETMPSEHAADLLRDAKLQAYLGAEPRFPGALPASIRAVESLGSFVIVRINPQRPAHDERSACAVVAAIVRDMAGKDGFVFHPYPVTPWHGDFLYHVDRAEAEKTRLLSALAASPPRNLMVRAGGTLARLVRPEWQAKGVDWDAAVEEVGAAELVAASTTSINGWLGPPWVKSGWFHAERILADATDDAEATHRTEVMSQRLETGDYRDAVERVNLERELVAELSGGCRKRVAGYTVKRQYFSAEFTNGIENIGFDSIEGLNSPIFIRTVKLKDFPWNGWLMLGIDAQSDAAWNPIAGFTDGFGQLLWSAIGDPALFSAPYGSGWMLNRIADVQSNSGR